MIGAPLRGPCVLDSRVSGTSGGASAPVGAPALSRSEQATNRPYVTKSRQVVGGTSLLPPHRQK